MWQRWMASYPDLELLDLDVGRGKDEFRNRRALHWLSAWLMPGDERALVGCLNALAHNDLTGASLIAEREARGYVLLLDLHMLAGAFLLSQGRCAEAVIPLERCFKSDKPTGYATRRLYPGLRILLRISPCLLMPLYPSPYAAALMYAVALWHSGALAEALDALRDMVTLWGPYDELKLVVGQIHLQRGETEKALSVLAAQDTVERDALELARCMYEAYAHYQLDEYRSAARVLGGAVKTSSEINPLLMARARLLLAECCERNGLLLDALRESAHVAADEVPGEISALMLEREERWVTELGLLGNVEVERLARADNYQVYLPDRTESVSDYSPLDTTRDPLKKLQPKEASWLKRQAEERKIAALHARAARGETVSQLVDHPLTALGRETRQSINTAQRWWPSRRAELSVAAPRERLAKPSALDVGHVRFDFCGERETDPYMFVGEKRSAMLLAIGGVALFIALVLWMLRSCVYWK
jgi:hypothetical protein